MRQLVLLNQAYTRERTAALSAVRGSSGDEKTIRRGREELAASLVNRPADRVRQDGRAST